MSDYETRIKNARRRQVFAITPSGLEPLAETLLERGLSFEEIRPLLLNAQRERFPSESIRKNASVEACKAEYRSRRPVERFSDDEILGALTGGVRPAITPRTIEQPAPAPPENQGR